MANRSREQRLLDDHPGLSERVSQMDDFIRWRATFLEPLSRGRLFQTAPLHMEHKRRLTSSEDGGG